MVDFSFIRLTLNDFALAKKEDNPNIAKLIGKGFINQLTNETFVQISNSSDGVAFVGGITVDLVDCNENVVHNIDENFYYENKLDSNGIEQIAFEFGNIGVDYWSKVLYLRVTDSINGNMWYSNGFLITDENRDISTRLDYTNGSKIYNIDYDLFPYVQSIRIADCYDQTPANTREVKQYVTSLGLQVNYRTITTFLRKIRIEFLNYFVNDRLEVLFSHQRIYANGQRVVVSNFKTSERIEDTNFFDGEFLVNPQNETYTFEYQLYEGLEVVLENPENEIIFTIGTKATSGNGGVFEFTFNKASITVLSGAVTKLYKDGIFVDSVIPTALGNVLTSDFSTYFSTLGNGQYDITVNANVVSDGYNLWSGYGVGDYSFQVVDGEFDNTEFSNEFLIN